MSTHQTNSVLKFKQLLEFQASDFMIRDCI